MSMNFSFWRAARWLLAVAALLPLAATAQTTLVITNGVQAYGALTSFTVTLSNRCELRVTNSTTPLTSCTINLNSSDAWLFLTGIKPSVAASTYLAQVFVSGAAAVADSNVRVVQYGAGTVVIPQPSSFQPLTVFSGPQFTGASAAYSQYVYYTGTGLGVMDQNISSFKLKRGYMAVMAQNTAGNGFSKCYVAQDADLEISVLPTTLENHIRFIYVTPWRWVSKKGVAGNPGISLLNVSSWYDWNIDQNSSRDLEYLPIRAQRYWPGLGQNWQTLGANTVMGYNEPDNTTANGGSDILVGDAIYSWPDLLGPGLRVGAPAVTDGGWAWITNFMSQADAAGLRVDFVPLHYYQWHNPTDPAGAATQMYNFLLARYNQFKRPLWVTEWNNGANWTDTSSTPAPTYAQQQACVAAMINMLETTPFVERYAIYNWVEDVRSVVNTNGVITAAGTTYSNQVSALSYTQLLPDSGARSLAEFLFETNSRDGSGYGNNGIAIGAPAYVAGHKGQAVMLDGTNNYLLLPPNLGNATNFSFAAWVNWSGGANWQRLFDFGDDTTHYLFLTPSSGSGTLRFAINNGSGEQTVETTGALPTNQWVHVCFTLSGSTGKIYTNGVLAASSTGFSIAPSSFTPQFNFLGKSQFTADPLFHGALDEVQLNDYALTAAQVAALVTNSPPAFSTNLLARGTASEAVAFNTNITSAATDPDPGDTLTYSKAAGPTWLSVSSGGSLTGTPGAADAGTNYFTVRVTDAAGASAFSVVAIYVSVIAANGVWINDGDGLWSTYANWSSSAVGNGIGQTADFSTINITANRTVTLDSKRSIGTLKFGDISGTQNWTLTSSGGTTLTLDTGSATSPSIVVNQNSVTNLVSLAGTNGFTKSGAGTLILGVDNSLSGTLNVDTAQPSVGNDGIVRVASPGGLGSISAITIRNQNAATSTLLLDGTNGNLTIPGNLTLNGRTAVVAAIENLNGTNTFSGSLLSVNTGGSYWIQSDAGQLTFAGAFTSVAAGTRNFTFQGNGNIVINGPFTNGSATAINLTKSGNGTLTLLGNNTYSGTTTISGGTLQIGNGGATGTLGTNNVANSGALIFNSSAATFAPITISGSGNVAKLGSGTLTFSNANSYTGGTLLAQGIIQVNNNFAFGTGIITNDSGANNARIILGNGVTVTNSFVANTVNPAASTGLIMVNDNTSATFAGPISILTNAASGGHFYGPFTTGLLSITGSIKSGVTNFLVIRAGNVRFSGGGNYFEIQPRANTASLGANNGLATNAAVDLAGNGSTTVPTILDLNGFNQTLSGLKNSVNNANVAWVTNSGATTNTLTLDLNNGATNTQSFGGSVIGGIALTLASGTQTFTKTGASALNGLYTYSGNTTLNGGKLILGSGITLPNTPQISLAAGAVLDASAVNLNLGAAQTLKGSGALIGALTVNGFITPGNGIGALSVTGAVTLASGGKYICDLASTTDSPGVNNDFLPATGTLTVSATSGSPFIIKPIASALAGWNNQTNYSWTLATGSSVSSFAANKFLVDTSAFANNLGGGNLVVAQTGNSLTLNFVPTIVPIQFTNAVFISGGAFKLAATGVPGNPYSLWSATNLASPINWLLSASTNADTNGVLNFSDALATNSPQKFYRLSSP